MRKCLLFAVMLFLMASPVYAFIINGGFETGNLTGWTTSGSANVVTSHTTDLGNIFSPKDGNYLLRLLAGMGANVYTTAFQSINLNSGQILEGWAEYDARDYYPYLDDAYVKINNSIVWAQDVTSVGNYGDSPWQQWSWTAPASGLYTLEFGVRNTGDNVLSPYALFDANVIVPEPASLSLLGLGLLGLLGLKKRKA